jgi:hypothetical protein
MSRYPDSPFQNIYYSRVEEKLEILDDAQSTLVNSLKAENLIVSVFLVIGNLFNKTKMY